ncbi:MAG: DUF1646 family protein [bacterium JZ-2024 1]
MVIFGLLVIFLVILVAPFAFKRVERNLEIFLLIMGVLCSLISGEFSLHLIQEGLREPIPISLAVLFFGLLFRWSRKWIRHQIHFLALKLSLPVFVFLLIVVLGLSASVITAIIASLVLVEIISAIGLERRLEIHLVVVSCFSIGLGAVLTAIGEPLSTIMVAKLRGLPYEATFLFPLKFLGFLVVPGIFLLGMVAMVYLIRKPALQSGLEVEEDLESLGVILLRAVKVYAFVMALVFLGQGFKPVIDTYIIRLPGQILYWVNMTSAILDNATLTAAEIGPSLSPEQIRFAIISLLISGGMLIPGNIPNIISAHKLHITSKEWAWTGVPIGLFLLVLYFVILLLLPQ